ncbi:hypothetical protein ACS0TY_004144 [Phlomoides rotata]
MQGLFRALKNQCYSGRGSTLEHINRFSFKSSQSCHQEGINVTVAQSGSLPEKGLQNTTVAQVLLTKGEEKVGSWIWCRTDDSVYDAIKRMAQNNIGSLVVLKPGEQQLIAGIFTERDYLRKVIVQDRSPKHTKVGEIMTDQDKLISVSSGTNVLHAMQLMTENHIRHAPVIDGKIVDMISMVDVVRAVLEQQHGEVKRLTDLIQGDYY